MPQLNTLLAPVLMYLGSRTEEKGGGAITKLQEEGIGSGDVVWLLCDLSTPALAKKSGETFLSKDERLDVLSTSKKAFLVMFLQSI